ncbi:hypothetical protein [Rhodoferax sp. GW822-FHT02A01]|uniref:hypothetical protein n=1 Tax=Rhodoferax sp. GW822-FHT02A01 TaxID=3141537 RepID=UPI00315D0CBB
MSDNDVGVANLVEGPVVDVVRVERELTLPDGLFQLQPSVLVGQGPSVPFYATRLADLLERVADV